MTELNPTARSIVVDDAVHTVTEHHVVPRAPTVSFVTREGSAVRDAWVVGPAPPELRDALRVECDDIDGWVPSAPELVEDASFAEAADCVVVGENLSGYPEVRRGFRTRDPVDEASVRWVEQGDEVGPFEVTSPHSWSTADGPDAWYPDSQDVRIGTSVDFVVDGRRVSYCAPHASGVVSRYHGDVEPDVRINDPRTTRVSETFASDHPTTESDSTSFEELFDAKRRAEGGDGQCENPDSDIVIAGADGVDM